MLLSNYTGKYRRIIQRLLYMIVTEKRNNMEILIENNVVTINGNIKSIVDYQEIKLAIDTVIKEHKSLTVRIPESISITSSIIGYLNKLILKEKINLNMIIGNGQLLDLLDDLNLQTLFKAKQG